MEQERVGSSINIRLPLCYHYSSNPVELQKEIEWCKNYYLSSSSNKKPKQSATNTTTADSDEAATDTNTIPTILLLPHGAYCDSGPLVYDALSRSRTITELASNKKYDVNETKTTVILIGTEHASTTRNKIYCSDYRYWQTPLGNVPVAENLLQSVKQIVPVDNSGFIKEHSIENQLPFLQTILNHTNWQMLALNVHGNIQQSDLTYIVEIGKKLASLLLLQKRNVAILGSTDYTHAGPGYGEMPPRTGIVDGSSSDNGQQIQNISVPDYIQKQDETFLNVLRRRPELPSIEELWGSGQSISMCGLGATLLVAEIAKNFLGSCRARVLRYAVGSDICDRGIQDQTGFATVKFEASPRRPADDSVDKGVVGLIKATAKKQYLDQGFVCPVVILSPDEANNCLRKLEKYEQGLEMTSLSGDNRFKLHLLLPWAWELVHHPRIVALACSCLETDDVWCWSTDINIKEPKSGTHYTWHQDSTYAGITPSSAAVTIWLALTPSSVESGCLKCIPNSHQEQLLHIEGRGGDDNALSLQQEVADLHGNRFYPDQAVALALNAGEASAHSFLTVHASMENTSNYRRIGFAMRFVSAHATKATGNVKESATLVSGNGHDLFEPELMPIEEFGKLERERHAVAMKRERSNYLPSGASYS